MGFAMNWSSLDSNVSRIRMENGEGAWCPKQPISSETYEYLEVDLRQLKVITMVETQGRFGNGQVCKFTYFVVSSGFIFMLSPMLLYFPVLSILPLCPAKYDEDFLNSQRF